MPPCSCVPTPPSRQLSGFLPLLGLLTDLYGGDTAPAPVPDCQRPDAAVQMAAVSIWTHLQKKAQSDHVELPVRLPATLQPRHDLLRQLANMGRPTSLERDFRLALVCNAFSTHPEQMQRHLNVLTEAIQVRHAGGGGGLLKLRESAGVRCGTRNTELAGEVHDKSR